MNTNFHFVQLCKQTLCANSGDPDQTAHPVSSNLGLRCLLIDIPQKDARLKKPIIILLFPIKYMFYFGRNKTTQKLMITIRNIYGLIDIELT